MAEGMVMMCKYVQVVPLLEASEVVLESLQPNQPRVLQLVEVAVVVVAVSKSVSLVVEAVISS